MTLRFNVFSLIARSGGLYFSKRYPELWRVRFHYVVVYGVFTALLSYFLAWSTTRIFTHKLLSEFAQTYIGKEALMIFLFYPPLFVPVYWIYRQLKSCDPSINLPKFSVIKTTLLSWICLVILCVYPFVFIVTLSLDSNKFIQFSQEDIVPVVLISFYVFFLLSIFIPIAASTGQKIAYIGIALAVVLPILTIFIIFQVFDVRSEESFAGLLMLFYFVFGIFVFKQKLLRRRSGAKYALVVAFLMLTPIAVSAGSAYFFINVLDFNLPNIIGIALILSAGPGLYLISNTFIQRLLHRLRTLPA